MKAFRIFGILSLSFCLWILLFPPWASVEFALIQAPDSTSFHRLGHHWRFTAPMYWRWDSSVRTSSYVPNVGARIDYRLMAYEIAIGLVAVALWVLIMEASSGLIRKLIVGIKVEFLLLRKRLPTLRFSAKDSLRNKEI